MASIGRLSFLIDALKKFVDVIVPLPIAGLYTYSLPERIGNNVQAGCRVIVSFGKKKFYTGMVIKVHDIEPENCETKQIEEVLDDRPILLPYQLTFWNWLSAYYLCTLGEVFKAALPSGMKLASETKVVYNPDYEAEAPLSEKEQQVVDTLSRKPEQMLNQLERITGLKNLLPVVHALLDKEAILIKEELRRTYKPKMETRVRLADAMGEGRLFQLFLQLKRAPKQLNLLMKYIELSQWTRDGKPLKEVTKKTLLEQSKTSVAALNGLIEKGVFRTYVQEIGRLRKDTGRVVGLNSLNASQQVAFDAVKRQFAEKHVCLLHGVTSSGKTEIYMHLIEETLRTGKQVLYLLPEIALTAQLTERLQHVFGERLGVYHSKYPDAERVEVWQKQLGDDPYQVILGVRSSVFLPFHRLGLVIVDEEHEHTYKQEDPAPRYHARSAAIMLARAFGAKVLLGTATPSIESYYNTTVGKYGLVTLKDRYKDLELPEVQVIDIKELVRKKMMKGPFSPPLIEAVSAALEKRQQAILFLNRRGFAPMMECRVCGWIPKCEHCDVSLTYHRGVNRLTCHYCGCTYQLPNVCPACGSTDMIRRGFGTERIEDHIKEIFPKAKVARMDLDTAKARSAYEKIISDFEAGKTDILVGTQMVSKGFDFDRVSVVGILNADSLLNYPDFRSYERAFQLMAQVAGRAGRKGKRGLVILQTKSPEVPVIRQVVTNDYDQLYRDQLAERQLFNYPPACRLVYVYLKHRKESVLDVAAGEMGTILRQGMGKRVVGPVKPPVSRIQTWFIRKMMLKIELQASMPKVRDYLLRVQAGLLRDERFRSLQVYYDVDPQ